MLLDLVAGVDSQTEIDYIEELLYRDEKVDKPLRLLCLLSQIQNGLKPKQYDFFRSEIIQSYGSHMIPILDALAQTNLFKATPTSVPLQTSPVSNNTSYISTIPTLAPASFVSSRSNYLSLKKQLRLVVDEINEENPQDMGYVYSGYAPLSCRLVEHLKNKTQNKNGDSAWKGIEEILKTLPGPTIEEFQRPPSGTDMKGILGMNHYFT